MENIVGIRDVVLVLPFIVIFLVSLIPLTIKVLNDNKEIEPYANFFIGLIALIVAAAFIAIQSREADVGAFGTSLSFDGINRWVSLLMIAVAGFTLFIGHNNIQTRGMQYSEFIFLVLNSLLGMLILSASSDLLITFIGIEVMSLSLYVLVGLSKEQVLSKEAAFKYFILGSLASAILLYGIALIYGSAGTTYIPDISKIALDLLSNDFIFGVGSLLLLVGLLFKVSIFPFHAWTPDVYQGAPTPVTAFMSTGVKIATFAFLLRIASNGMFEGNALIFNLLQWFVVLSVLVGNIGATIQQNLKRMLAYSSIAHSGYMLIGIMVLAANPNDGLAMTAVLFYMLTYAIVNIGSFGIVSLFESKEEKSIYVEDLSGLAKERPLLALTFTLFMLSLAGIPPLAGFFAKVYLFSSALQYGYYWVSIWGVIGSVISVYYYLRPVIHMYMKDTGEKLEVLYQELNAISITVCVVLVLALGILSSGVIDTIQAAL